MKKDPGSRSKYSQRRGEEEWSFEEKKEGQRSCAGEL